MYAKLYTLLNDPFHLISLWKTLEQIDRAGKFRVRLLLLHNRKHHSFFQQFLDPAQVFPVHIIVYTDFLSNLHTKNMYDVVYIGSLYINVFPLHLRVIYKKILHGS